MKRMIMLIFLFVASMGILGFVMCTSTRSGEKSPDEVLDDFHDAASKADGTRYFSLFAEGAIFLGTDGTERWTVKEFKEYANPFFDQGRGWTYTKKSRHVYFSRNGNTAWFDEVLENAKYGECRGSGVLIKSGEVWKITQYNLTIPIPNSLAGSVVEKIRNENR